MLYYIAVVQTIIFGVFYLIERRYPHHHHPKPQNFNLWWYSLGVFALIWLRIFFYLWVELPDGLISLPSTSIIAQGFMFYAVYSCGNYWIHRWKHSNPILWKFIHKLHHSPSHMETRLSFYRHPVEIMFNSVYIVLLGGLVLGLPIEVIAIALAIEGCLECFHHSNIKLPEQFSVIGYIFQTPEMHLVHHEYGLHRYNYSPFLWDSVFGTARIPEAWNKKLGFKHSKSVMHYLLFKN